MKKNLFAAFLLGISSVAFAQTGNVGINTSTPAVTLDVVGQPATSTKLDGIIAPRLTGDQLFSKTYGTPQKGALVYVTAAAAVANQVGQTSNVNLVGYYYFDADVNKWVYMNPAAIEPWMNAQLSIPATGQGQNLYTLKHVSVGANRPSPVFNVSNTAAEGANNEVVRYNLPSAVTGATSWYSLMGNTVSGSYNMMLTGGDIPFIFRANDKVNYSQNGVLIAPATGNNVTYGLKITDQGRVAVDTQTPSETFDVGGTARLRNLPASGTASAIYTNAGGTSTQPAPLAPDQTFTGTRTVVADNNGVLGYVQGLPQGNLYATDGTLAGNRTVTYNGNNLSFNGSPGTVTTFSQGTTMMLTGMVHSHRELLADGNVLAANDYTLFKDKSNSDITFTLSNNGPQTGRVICFSNVAKSGNLTVITGTNTADTTTKTYTFPPDTGKCFQFVGANHWLPF